MGNKLATRLPLINSLSLDRPLPPLPLLYDHSLFPPVYGGAVYSGYADQLRATPPAAGASLPGALVAHPRQPVLLGMLSPERDAAATLPPPHVGARAGSGVRVGAYSGGDYTVALAAPAVPAVAISSAPELHVVTQTLPVAEHRRLPLLSAKLLVLPPPFVDHASALPLTTPHTDAHDSSAYATLAPALPKSPQQAHLKGAKPRKKRQCPECHEYFSNLATHKLTHLNPTLRPHVCKICQRGFARPNDLFRHFKCHWKEMGADNGQFKCPFKNGPRGDHCCHLLGIFSRCDTYKNHLKAIHFQYPGGTKKSERNHVPGSCRLCQQQFANVDEWISTHVDLHQCPFVVK